jgi:methionyl-tRNA formyltransferase
VKFAAIGRTGILLESIQQAISNGHTCPLIITSSASPESEVTELDFEQLANEIKAAFLNTRKINSDESHKAIQASGAEVAISLNWAYLINRETLDLFPHGIINSHAGDLPRYRGNATPNWAILMGESNFPITLHFMAEELDAGDILAQRFITITSETHIKDIYDFSAEVVPQMFAEVLDKIENGSLNPRKQSTNPKAALRCYPRLPQDSFIDWTHSAEKIHQLVRAVSEPFNGAYTYFGHEKLIIWRAEVEIPDVPFLAVAGHVIERRNNGDIVVATGDGFLVLKEVELGENGERRKAGDIIKSVRIRLGMNPSDEIAKLAQRIAALEVQIGSKS